jgi:hypothetical protein
MLIHSQASNISYKLYTTYINTINIPKKVLTSFTLRNDLVIYIMSSLQQREGPGWLNELGRWI